MKRCSKCKHEYSSDFFRPKQTWCKSCQDAYLHERYLKERQAVIDRASNWRTSHPDKYKESQRRSRNKQKESNQKYSAAYRKAHPEKKREGMRRWRERHPEMVNLWRKLNPFKALEYKQNRRSREEFDGGSITAEEWESVLDRYGHHCLYPGCVETKVTMDHVIPLSKGGRHSIDNVQPLCKRHNSRKNASYVDYRH
jgi:5-methylcytosine-specific restriction endonuclease McrA